MAAKEALAAAAATARRDAWQLNPAATDATREHERRKSVTAAADGEQGCVGKRRRRPPSAADYAARARVSVCWAAALLSRPLGPHLLLSRRLRGNKLAISDAAPRGRRSRR
ncbi:hypothetical protein MTO96_003164 [Rhipicephalus appendiculatus]